MRLSRVAAVAVFAAACVDQHVLVRPPLLTAAELADPRACGSCHPDQFAAWSVSRHAGASDDEVFIAMRSKAERDSGGKLGALCRSCHAPMVAEQIDGVSCLACHSVSGVASDHNGDLVRDPVTIFGGSASIRAPSVHRLEYSPLFDSTDPTSSLLCGGCHDVVNDLGLRVESTYADWRASIYKDDSCGRCHLEVVPGSAGAVHDHRFAAVGLPSDELGAAIQSALCVEPGEGGATIRVVLHSRKLGHSFPGGAAHNRRLWTEVVAYRGAEVVASSGVFADDQSTAAASDDLWLLRDCLYSAAGDPVRFFWQAADKTVGGLPPRTRMARSFQSPTMPDRVTLRLRLRPIAFDVLDALVASGDLNAAARQRAVTLDLDLGAGPLLEWTPGTRCVTASQLDGQRPAIEAPTLASCQRPPR